MTILYVSDTHGNLSIIENLTHILNSTSEELATDIIFLGDIVGTENLRKLQKLFYNVFNQIKGSTLASEDLQKDMNIYAATGDLAEFMQNDLCSDPIKFTDLIEIVRKSRHYEHFCSFLPKTARKILSQELNNNILPLIKLCKEFNSKGVKIHFIMGNHDLRTPFDFDQSCTPLPIKKRDFYLPNILAENNLHCVDSIETIEIGNTLHVLVSFDAVINAIDSIKSIDALPKNKEIILCFHGIVKTEIFGNPTITDETQKIISGCEILIEKLNPQVILHGHQHIAIDGEPITIYYHNNIKVHYIAENAIEEIEFQN